MRIETRDSLEFLYPDGDPGRRPVAPPALEVPRGGTIAVNVLVHGAVRGMAAPRVTERGRPVRGARWYRLHDVPVEENTAPVIFTESRRSGRNRHVTRRAPFRVFDAMEPVPEGVRLAAGRSAFVLQVPVRAGDRPGPRRFEIRAAAAGPVALKARVHRVVVPPAGPASFPYTNWFDVPAMATRHGLTLWSEAHWRMIRRYADLMRHARQNVFWIPLHLVFRRERGLAVLDRPRLVRFVDLFTRAGLHWIEGGHVAGRAGGDWKAGFFSVVLDGPRASSPAGDRDLRSICSQLKREIDRHGWGPRWIQHVADEPNPAMASDYRIICGIVRKYLPGIPLLDAIEDPSLAGSVDIWCPKGNAWQTHRKAYDAIRAAGDRMWFYTCCEPGGAWLNRLLDMELLRPALFGWFAARFDLDGFLHWGLNHWQKNQDPFRRSVIPAWGGSDQSLPAGDTHIVYPGAAGPWSSVRLEAQREGFEDLELLRRLRPAAVARITRPALRSFNDYSRDVRVFRRARAALLRSA